MRLSHCLIHSFAFSVLIGMQWPLYIAGTARWSAISFPGTFVCERTCAKSTSPGRHRCTRRHSALSLVMTGAFALPFRRGIHFPVAMFSAYSESECTVSRPLPLGLA